MQPTILIIDDEEQLRKLLGRIISLEGFNTEQTGNLKSAWPVLSQKNPEVVLCDVKLPDGNGVDFVKEAKAKFPLTEFILLTAYGNIADGVQAIKNGAFDYITKGNDNDRIVPLLYQATQKVSAARQSAVKIAHQPVSGFNNILGNSPAITNAISLARKIAPTESNVLLLGETGTGKEVFATAIHFNSKRATRPLVAVNCSAFPKDLLESELFGHKAGAFTGAAKDKKGLIETADTGTLFLDEIGEMNIDLQAKLLRFIEAGEYFKLGDDKLSRSDVRIIAATNRNLKKEIADGLFREDLYYRLNVFAIELPPLRDRPADIPDLARYFLQLFREREKRQELAFSQEALDLLKRQRWSGNIRELKNVIERAVVLAEGSQISTADFPFDLQRNSASISNELTLASVEQLHIRKVLKYANGNKTKAAEFLGIGLTTLYRKMEEYNIPK